MSVPSIDINKTALALAFGEEGPMYGPIQALINRPNATSPSKRGRVANL